MEQFKDHRKLKLSNTDDKKHLTDFVQSYIDLSKEELARTGYVDICNKIALSVEGHQMPVGFTDGALEEFVKQNIQNFDLRKFQVQKRKGNIIYFSDNRVGEMERGYVAEFTKAKKVLKPMHDTNPRNDRLEWAVGKFLEKWERRKRLWELVRIPVIRYMLRYNKAYTRPYYNPYRIKGLDDIGDISIDYFHPLSVLPDPYPDKKSTVNSRFIIPFKKIPLDQARLMFQSMGYDPDKVISDTEADTIMSNGMVEARTSINDQFVTVYLPEWKQFNLDSINLGIIQQDERGNLTPTQLQALNSYCFTGIYNTSLGLCDFRLNKYADPRDDDGWQFQTIPYEDEQSDLSVFGNSRIGKNVVLNDLLNVVLTVKLNSERHRMAIRGFIAKTLYQEWGKDTVQDFIDIGAILPVDLDAIGPNVTLDNLLHIIQWPNESASLTELITIIDQVLKRNSIRKEILQGQLPTKTSEQMSGKLAKELKDSNATLLQPIVQSIELGVGLESGYIYRILAEEFGEDEWVEITDGKKEDPKYIPIEAHWPSARFYQYLGKAYPNLPPEQAAMKFSERSMVEIERKWRGADGEMLTPEQVEAGDIYHINSLKDQDGEIQRFGFNVSLTFDIDDTKYEDKVLAAQLFARNPDSATFFEIFLENQGGYWADNKDMLVEKYTSERDAMKKLQFIESLGPEFWAEFQQYAQQWMMSQKIKSAGQGGNSAKAGAKKPVQEAVEQ